MIFLSESRIVADDTDFADFWGTLLSNLRVNWGNPQGNLKKHPSKMLAPTGRIRYLPKDTSLCIITQVATNTISKTLYCIYGSYQTGTELHRLTVSYATTGTELHRLTVSYATTGTELHRLTVSYATTGTELHRLTVSYATIGFFIIVKPIITWTL